MLILKLKTDSVVELATHVLPEFDTFTLLIRGDFVRFDEIAVGEAAKLELECPDSQKKSIRVDVTVVFHFEVGELKNWLAVAISTEQQASIQHVRYLCRHYTSEYGKLFHQVVNDYCHSHQC